MLLVGATFVAMLGASLSVAVPSASADEQPDLSVTVNPDGSLHATWTMAADQDAYEFLYDTSSATNGRLTPAGTLSTDEDGVPICLPDGSWCWPANGDPLYCYYVLYNSRTGDCPGHFDLGDADTSYDTDPLQVGETYYVQVFVANHCFTEDTCQAPGENWDPYYYWSNVVQIVDNPPTTTTTSSTTTTTTVPEATTTTTVHLDPIALLPVIKLPLVNGTAGCDDARDQLALDNLVANYFNPLIEKADARIAQANAAGSWTDEGRAAYGELRRIRQVWAQRLGAWQAADQAKAEEACSSHAAVARAFEANMFNPLPVPRTNGTAACNADIKQINYLNTMLSRAFKQLGFRALSLTTNFQKEVPIQQLQTQINRLDAQMTAVWGRAWAVDCV
ncbi:MAG TPA: hypothetical protein VED59_06390 [Acidimicrobiales bacterium]|nr:hypothetical protein [Acidimicrobiales bacterium]